MKKYLFFILINFIYPYGVIADDDMNRLSYSLSKYRDSEDYYSWDDLNNPKLERYNAYLTKADFSILLKGKYEILFTYAYNESGIVDEVGKSLSLNAFAMPSDKEHMFLKFIYHFKERDKFPLNLLFGFEYGENITYDDSYESFSFNLGLYKKFNTDNYPIVPYIDFTNTKSINKEYNNSFSEFKDSYLLTRVGLFINLPVESLDNSSYRDIIWLNPSFTLNDKDIYFGFNIGLSHPLNN
tara:strand:- start:1091 stop:1810 length:720 start_codon:yes stop_codon:yes gene_type:complete